MAKYRVKVRVEYWIDVEATDEEAAEELALDSWSMSDDVRLSSLTAIDVVEAVAVYTYQVVSP